jgi:hypothetical protein
MIGQMNMIPSVVGIQGKRKEQGQAAAHQAGASPKHLFGQRWLLELFVGFLPQMRCFASATMHR